MVVVLNAPVSEWFPRVILGLPFEEISASAIEAAGSALTQGVLMPTAIDENFFVGSFNAAPFAGVKDPVHPQSKAIREHISSTLELQYPRLEFVVCFRLTPH